ncbi:MAG: hypothetical protein R3F59_26505 [Myxococcota bacterium]
MIGVIAFAIAVASRGTGNDLRSDLAGVEPDELEVQPAAHRAREGAGQQLIAARGQVRGPQAGGAVDAVEVRGVVGLHDDGDAGVEVGSTR